MNMQTNLIGRLRNTTLPVSSGMLPLFEAVINSIHAIEEAGLDTNDGRIAIKIERLSSEQTLEFDDAQKKRGPEPVENIYGFTITDNGIGFNDANFDSFKILDTDHKSQKGCRGIGRLLWLKAFEEVKVKSFFYDDNKILKLRSFRFNAGKGVFEEEVKDAPKNSSISTEVSLVNFNSKYLKYAHKTAKTIAKEIVEHCLWHFVREGGAPKISIEDDEFIDLDDVYTEHMHTLAVPEDVKIKNTKFTLLHIKLRATSHSTHTVSLCAGNRLVCEEKIAGKINGLHGKLSDANGDFVYTCYVNSEFLDECVHPDRTGFDLLEEHSDLFANTEITKDDIMKVVLEKAAIYLSEQLQENRNNGLKRVHDFVSNVAPKYRPILGRIPENDLSVDPNISDKDLDILLHKFLSEIERELISEGHDIMDPKLGENFPDYQKRLNEYLRKTNDIKKSDLANYVTHRKLILEFLEKAIQIGRDGKYAREDLIHNLIMPMRKESKEVMFDSCNLWLIDERLAFHDFLASDKSLSSMPITGSSETKEPDICVLNVFDNPILVSEGTGLPLASIIIVEIKRPMRNDASEGEDKNPISQMYGYLERIRNGKVKTSLGRQIPNSESIPGYCYAICDITDTVENQCRLATLSKTSDGLGYFGYNQNYKAYIEVISYDRLLNMAKQRNRAFFDKLGLPSR